MPTKPNEYPDWATEDQIDPVSGQNNVLEPPPTKKESGWDRSEIPPRQWFNWLLRKTAAWLRWLEGASGPKTISGATTNDVPSDGSGHTHDLNSSSATTSTSTTTIANSNAVKIVRDRAGPKTVSGSTGNAADGDGHSHEVSKSNAIDSNSETTLATSKAVKDLGDTFPFRDEAIGVALGGGFPSGGTFDVVRLGRLVTLTVNDNGSGSISGTTGTSGGSPIPSWARPLNQTQRNVYRASPSVVLEVLVSQAGDITITPRSWDGSINSSGQPFWGQCSISYIV